MHSFLENSILHMINTHKEFFFNKKNVLGLGLGFKFIKNINTLEPTLHVLVKEKLPLNKLYKHDLIPQNFLGLKTDVIKTELLTLNSQNTNPSAPPLPSAPDLPSINFYHPPFLNSKIRPLKAGYSISPAFRNIAGTIGAIVFDNYNNMPYILSNNHVLCDLNSLPIGTPIVQPGNADFPGEAVASLSRYVYINFDNPLFPIFPNNIDCAIASIYPNIKYTTEIDFIGKIKGTIEAKLGMNLLKIGRTTGVTEGIVQTINSLIKVKTPLGISTFDNIIVATSTNKLGASFMSKSGDSGSLAINHETKKAVGLIFAGGLMSFICPIDTVLQFLNVHF